MTSLRFPSSAPEETQRCARALGALLQAGDVLALVGDLGSGKTCFVQGLAEGLAIPKEAVSSPTFVLLNLYRGPRLPLYHFDAYRLSGAPAWLDLGVEDFLGGDGVCVIEWADRILEALPSPRLEVQFTHAGTSCRQLQFVARGPRAEALLRQLASSLPSRVEP